MALLLEHDLTSACDARYRFGQVLMDRANRRRALADRPGYALDGAVARVAYRKYAWHAGLQRQRLMLQRPSLLGNVTPCQDVLAVVALDDVAKPFRSRFGTDHDEDRRRGDFLALPVSTFSNVRISRRSPPRPSTTRVRRRTSTSVL